MYAATRLLGARSKGRINTGVIASMALLTMLLVAENSRASDTAYDRDPVNGHAGFLSAWRVTGELDMPVVVVKGYDTINKEHPTEFLAGHFGLVVQPLIAAGHDIIVFDYVDGEADLKENADNLAELIRHLDTTLAANGTIDRDGDGHPDYPLAIVGGSMGGIVARTMFVQENEAMGVDIFVTIDSPHHGVQLSPLVDWVTEFLDSVAGHQMLYGDDAYFTHYDWLRSAERMPEFKLRVIDPMDTAAIALSDGESDWHLDAGDLLSQTDFHAVSSYVAKGVARSDYVPYHSAVNMDNIKTELVDRGLDYKDLRYVDTHTSYFDKKIGNSRDRHDAPDYAIRQAMGFISDHSARPKAQSYPWLSPILDLLLQ